MVQKVKIVTWSWNLVLRLIWISRLTNDAQCLCFIIEITFFFCKYFGPKNQNCGCQLKFGTYTNSNILNLMVMRSFSVLNQKHCFRSNVVQKIKIVTLAWNLVPRLFWRWESICRCWLFIFYTRNKGFGKIWWKKTKLLC